MTLHAIRAVGEKPTGVTETDAQQLVEQAIADFDRELPAQELRIRAVDDDLTDKPPHFQGLYRFSDAYDASRILGFIEQALRDRDDVSWFELRYHECYHDDPSGGTCDESVVASVGDFPSGI